VLFSTLLLASGCGNEGGEVHGVSSTHFETRVARRAFDGAPPVIPHAPFGGVTCMSCHTERGIDVPDVGFAPAMPHEGTGGLSAVANCQQCHLFQADTESFRESSFEGFRRKSRRGTRQHSDAPPVMPHSLFMHENCLACHSGPGSRQEIRTTHPERENCTQCHLGNTKPKPFSR